MKNTLKENIECLLKDTYQRCNGEVDYCLLYYPSRLKEIHCPYLQKESVIVTFGEGLLSTKLDYWRCCHGDSDWKTDRSIIRNFKRRLSDG